MSSLIRAAIGFGEYLDSYAAFAAPCCNAISHDVRSPSGKNNRYLDFKALPSLSVFLIPRLLIQPCCIPDNERHVHARRKLVLLPSIYKRKLNLQRGSFPILMVVVAYQDCASK